MKSIENTQYQQAENFMLGKQSVYPSDYNPSLLFPITRDQKRMNIGIDPQSLPFSGLDLWRHYEVSWLNPQGKPMVCLAALSYDCHSPCIIESKSMKLYFNSLNQTAFEDIDALQATLTTDLSHAVGDNVAVSLSPLEHTNTLQSSFEGQCLDDLAISCDTYTVNPDYLTTHDSITHEKLHSNLLKSNCLVTGQPDWGSVLIDYHGPQIDHEGLLQYIVSFRQHNEFHEQCIERIFMDISQRCHPTSLTVHGCYTRRGGTDINPIRSTQPISPKDAMLRLVRQ